MSVIEVIDNFFQTQGFMPHGMCLLWKPSILWAMVLGNAVIAFSYFMIPVALIYLVLKRRDIGFKWIFVLFGAFILACGFTHIMGIVTLWKPLYGLEALVLVFTAIISLATAMLLWPLLPSLFKIPSPWLLEKMNEELKRINEKLAQTELMQSKLAAIVEFTDDAIISKTLDRIIDSWNEGAVKLYGYEEQEVIGKPISIIFPENRLYELQEIEEKMKLGEPLHYLETERKHKDEHIIPVSITYSPIKNNAGKLVGSCSIGRDITEWNEVKKMKDEFVSIVSHELRTPLTSIQGSLSLLVAGAAGEMPDKAQHLLQIGKQNTERLVRLINDILDIAKIEAGKMDFKIETLDIALIIKEAIDTHQTFADKFHIKVNLEESSSILVNIDHDRLLQVVINLLSNAIKFSPQDETVNVSIKENNKNMVMVAITNKGAGIPKEFQAHIFKKFSQANMQATRTQAGTGLGLSISKEIVERLNGNIGFTSEENKETTFFFELPVATKLPVLKKIIAKIPTVLICQDDEESSKKIKSFLENNGFMVNLVSSAKDARLILGEKHIDALLLDLKLPDIDGITFIKELRVKYTAQDLPIIVISLMIEKGKEEVNGNALSILDWIEKPINVERLVSNIQLIKKRVAAKTPNILFIENELDLIEIIGNLLQNDATIVGAMTLAEARKELESKKFDLIILDLLLSDGSGVDLLPEISKTDTPIIVFSAYELPSKFTPYVIKTLLKTKTSPHELLQIIKNSLFNRKIDEKIINNEVIIE